MGLCGAGGEGFGDGDPCGSGREGLGQGEDAAGSGVWGPGVLVASESGRGMLEVLGVRGMEPASLPALLEGDSSPCPSAKPLPGPEGLLFITNRGQWAGEISGVPMREPCSGLCVQGTVTAHHGQMQDAALHGQQPWLQAKSAPRPNLAVAGLEEAALSPCGERVPVRVSTAGSWAHFSPHGRAKQPGDLADLTLLVPCL